MLQTECGFNVQYEELKERMIEAMKNSCDFYLNYCNMNIRYDS